MWNMKHKTLDTGTKFYTELASYLANFLESINKCLYFMVANLWGLFKKTFLIWLYLDLPNWESIQGGKCSTVVTVTNATSYTGYLKQITHQQGNL